VQHKSSGWTDPQLSLGSLQLPTAIAFSSDLTPGKTSASESFLITERFEIKGFFSILLFVLIFIKKESKL
jgi:hypothetical protein